MPDLKELSNKFKESRESYQKIIVAIEDTFKKMIVIDEIIDCHGGWPEAFA
jgi:hypothetical protein